MMALSLVNSEDVSESIGRYERYTRCLLFIPLYMFVKRFNLKLSAYLSWSLVLGCLVTGLVAIYQYHILEIMQPSGARQINRFGFTAVLLFLLLVVQIIFNWKKKIFVLSAMITSIVIVYAIILNKTRGAMVCVFPFLALIFFYVRDRMSRRSIYFFLVAFLMLLFIFLHPSSMVAQWFQVGFEQFENFIEDPLVNYKNSWGMRSLLMYHGLLIFMQSPVLGTGLGDYYNDLTVLMESGKAVVNDPILLEGPHNIFIHYLAETGIVGCAAFITSIFIIPTYIYTKYLIRHGQNKHISLFCLSGLTTMICHFVFGMFNTWLTNNSISIYLIFNLIFMSSIFLELNKNKDINDNS